jgi:hypothetical protein
VQIVVRTERASGALELLPGASPLPEFRGLNREILKKACNADPTGTRIQNPDKKKQNKRTKKKKSYMSCFKDRWMLCLEV